MAYESFHIDQRSFSVLQTDDVNEIARQMFDKFTERIFTKLELESDYVYHRLIHADLIFVKWSPIRGRKHIETPLFLKRLNSIINIQNTDDQMCLVWSVLAILYPKKQHRRKVKSYERHLSSLNLDGMDFTELNTKSAKSLLIKMGQNNPTLSICCYIVEEKDKAINIFYVSDRYDVSKDVSLQEINLLLIEKDGQYHFVAVKNLKALVKYLHTKSGVSTSKFQVCRRCLALIYSERKFQDHRILCQDMEAQVVVLPKEGTIYKYKDFHKEHPLMFSAYCDMETYMVPVLGCDPKPVEKPHEFHWVKFDRERVHVEKCTKCTKDSGCSEIIPLQVNGRHIVYSWGLKVQCYLEGYYDFPLIIEYGPEEELMEKFLVKLKEYCVELYEIVNSPRPIIITELEEQEFQDAIYCRYCQVEFDEEHKKIRDHCHVSGLYRYYYY